MQPGVKAFDHPWFCKVEFDRVEVLSVRASLKVVLPALQKTLENLPDLHQSSIIQIELKPW